MKILIVEDEKIQRVALSDDLKEHGHQVTAAPSAVAGLELVRNNAYDVILLDLKMPVMNGIEFLKAVKKLRPEVEVIMMTAYATVETAVQAMKLGAFDYLTKPFKLDEVLLHLDRIERFRTVLDENRRLLEQLEDRYSFGKIIGKSIAMQEVYRQLQAVAPTDSTVLLIGETGTGKEMAANAIHFNSPRKDGPFVKVSCAILSREVLESELFGHERGAFTGAVRDKKGRFELADGGTIFLDEVDDIPLDLQVKLLRVLQEQSFERVGGTETLHVDVRIIAATKADLRALADQGRFREDLFYRLNVLPIQLPPLRERKEDIPLLFDFFLREFNTDHVPEVAPRVMAHLMNYSWPGNVRELKNLVERLSLVCQCDPIEPWCLPDEISRSGQAASAIADDFASLPLDESVAQFEKRRIQRALSECQGNRSRAAAWLGIPVSTLKSKMKKYGLT